MIRKIVNINEEKCNGCGACAAACHEHAIVMIDGKARLIKDDYCDGLGDCLPACPADAITIIEREAAEYDHEAVMARVAAMQADSKNMESSHHAAKKMHDKNIAAKVHSDTSTCSTCSMQSCLKNWPVQIKLAPIKAPYFHGSNLLIAADCTAYAYGNFHNDFMDGRVTLIGCPKLDAVNYSSKLAEIFRQNEIQEITLTRMVVPCCGGMSTAIQQAIANSGKLIPLHIVTIDTDGSILKTEQM